MRILSNIINGRQEAEKLLNDLSQKITKAYDLYKIRPTIAIILIGNNPASVIYVNHKINDAKQIGISALKIELPEDISNQELFNIVEKLNNDKSISGIITQLPIPSHLNKDKLLSSILPEKDVDGFHPINVGYLHNNAQTTHFVPGTALGCLHLAEKYEPTLSGKHVVIVGRSNIVGRPLSALFLNKNCTVTLCHSKTQNLSNMTYNGDIVVTAIGRPSYFTTEYFNRNSIVIDVGINNSADNKLIGDVDFDNVYSKVRYITPVPGGVGPLTRAYLLLNTFKAMTNQHNLDLP